MSDLQHAFAAFEAADAVAWPGLPADVRIEDLRAVAACDPDDLRPGEAGDPPAPRRWIPLDSGSYAGGLRAWVAGDRVLALEGIHPLDGAGEFRAAVDLGPPEARLESLLGPLHLAGGELVYARRGLAVRVNPENGLLLGLVGFVPTTVADYCARIRPVQEEPQPLRPLREVIA
jgi:hypothetical protein